MTIFLVVSIPTIGTIILVLLSSRPSLSDRSFSNSGNANNIEVVDWPKLYVLNDEALKSGRLPKNFADSDVRVPGYMLSFQQSFDREGKVAEFLLVPDAGNWLHPPHLDSGEVVYVRMSGAAKTGLVDRTPVWVQGRLSAHLVSKGQLHHVFELAAVSVWELKEVH